MKKIIKILILATISAVFSCLEMGCIRQNKCEAVENAMNKDGVLVVLSQPKIWVQGMYNYQVVQTAYFIPDNPSDSRIDSVLSGIAGNYFIIEKKIPKKFKPDIPYYVSISLRECYRISGEFPHPLYPEKNTYRICCIEEK